MTDPDTIALAAAAILDTAHILNEDGTEDHRHWNVLADWLNSVLVRAEAGDVGVDHDYAVTFARALLEGDDV